MRTRYLKAKKMEMLKRRAIVFGLNALGVLLLTTAGLLGWFHIGSMLTQNIMLLIGYSIVMLNIVDVK